MLLDVPAGKSAQLAARRLRLPSSLFARVLALNASIIVAAFVLVALGPITVSPHVTGFEGLILGLVTAGAIIADVLFMRVAFTPLRRLTTLMRGVDPLQPGTRTAVQLGPSDVQALQAAFNDMLDRLENERRDSAHRAVMAQEAERRRIARELHDELGQSLTGVLLQVDALARDPSAGAIDRTRESARRSLEEVRRIARDLRPDTLDELGLLSSLHALATTFTRHTGVPVDRALSDRLPPLGDAIEVVLYRVTQEALTNVARHAGAHHVQIALSHGRERVQLTIADDGRGPGAMTADGRGITGMRERALLVRGRLIITSPATGGTRVMLIIPTPP